VEIPGNSSLIVTITVNYLYYQITSIGTFWGGWSGNSTVISGNSTFITLGLLAFSRSITVVTTRLFQESPWEFNNGMVLSSQDIMDSSVQGLGTQICRLEVDC